MKALRYLPLISILLLRAGAPVPAESAVVSVTVEPGSAGGDTVLTFAHAFRQGDISETLAVRSGSQNLPAQVDVKRRYADGSVKHAIITAAISGMSPGVAIQLDLYTERASAHQASKFILPEGFEAEVVFAFPDGNERRASAREFLTKAQAGEQGFTIVPWLSGPLASEVQLIGSPVGKDGDRDPDLLVVFGLRVLSGGRAVRTEVVVESPWVDVPGNVPYDVRVAVGGEQVMAAKNVGYWRHQMPYWLKDGDRNLGHFAHGRWRKVFWRPKPPAAAHVRYDLSYLCGTGLLPPYDCDVVISDEMIGRNISAWAESPRGILENGVIMAYFPTTGGREDLGPYPTWTTRYLLSQDRNLFAMVLGTGDLAGSFPVHIRDRVSHRIFSIDEHPGYSLNPRGTLEKISTRDAADRPYLRPAASPYEVDNAHQPSLAFVPYLVTGDYYYLEEMHFWANWCMLVQNAAYRQKDRGLLTPDQIRGTAWALRQLVDAAKICPDDHPEKSYFDDKTRQNLAALTEFINAPDATALGTYTAGASDAYVRGRSSEERRKWLTLAPWQENFLVWSLDHAVRAGYAAAVKPRDYFMKLQIGLLSNPDDFDIDYAAPYFLVVGEQMGEQVRWYQTWKELFDKSFRVVEPDAKPNLTPADYGSAYPYIARAVLLIGVNNGIAGAGQALNTLESKLANINAVLAKDPTWAFDRFDAD